MKILTYGLMLIVSIMVIIGASIEFLVKYSPIAINLIYTYIKKVYSYMRRKTNEYFKNPTYSY